MCNIFSKPIHPRRGEGKKLCNTDLYTLHTFAVITTMPQPWRMINRAVNIKTPLPPCWIRYLRAVNARGRDITVNTPRVKTANGETPTRFFKLLFSTLRHSRRRVGTSRNNLFVINKATRYRVGASKRSCERKSHDPREGEPDGFIKRTSWNIVQNNIIITLNYNIYILFTNN